MKRNLFDQLKYIVIGLLCFSLIISIGAAFTGDAKEIPLIIGIMGIIEFGFMFLVAFICDKSPQDQEQLNYDYYMSLVELLNNNPQKFNKKYKRLIGYGTRYIILLFVLVILVIEGLLAISISIGHRMGGLGIFLAGLIGVLYIVIKSLYIKPTEIGDYIINNRTSPEIFKIIDSARKKTNAPTIQKVCISYDSNCGVFKRSIGFGIKSENVLCIGIYLLLLLSTEELESILIHEFAHIYNKDTYLSNKINRSITRWTNILENCEKHGFIVNTLLKRFAENYIVKMQMFYTVDSKPKEILADKEAAKYCGNEMYAQASMKIALIEYYFSLPGEKSNIDFRTFDAPPKNAYDLLTDSFIREFEKNKNDWINQILRRMSNKGDTHPSYKERMTEIGIDSFDFNIILKKSTHPQILKIVNDLNAGWHKNMVENWEEYTDNYKKSKSLVQEFELSDDNNKNLEYAMALEVLSNNDQALKIYETILKSDENFAPALFRSGLIYLYRDDEKGLELIKSAIEKDNDFIVLGLQLIQEFLDRNGLKDTKDALRDWALKKSDLYDKKIEETENLYPDDIFYEAEFSKEQTKELKEKLENIKSIKKVFVATKKLKYSEFDLLVIGVVSKQKIFKLLFHGIQLYDTEAIWEAINTFNIPCFLLDLNKNKHFSKTLALVKNSELIRR